MANKVGLTGIALRSGRREDGKAQLERVKDEASSLGYGSIALKATRALSQ
jgi:hypothetical protein